MSTALSSGLECRAITTDDLDAVMHIEGQAYEFPWTRGNFVDSLVAGYWAQALFQRGNHLSSSGPDLQAYAWAMSGVGEVHLLNLTVAPGAQGRGHARFLLNRLLEWSRSLSADDLWLEVRPSNLRAIALYDRYGFQAVGRRLAYYPASSGGREDAVVMSFNLREVDSSAGYPIMGVGT